MLIILDKGTLLGFTARRVNMLFLPSPPAPLPLRGRGFANATYILPLWTTFGARTWGSAGFSAPAADSLLGWRGTGLLPPHYEELMNLLW